MFQKASEKVRTIDLILTFKGAVSYITSNIPIVTFSHDKRRLWYVPYGIFYRDF